MIETTAAFYNVRRPVIAGHNKIRTFNMYCQNSSCLQIEMVYKLTCSQLFCNSGAI